MSDPAFVYAMAGLVLGVAFWALMSCGGDNGSI